MRRLHHREGERGRGGSAGPGGGPARQCRPLRDPPSTTHRTPQLLAGASRPEHHLSSCPTFPQTTGSRAPLVSPSGERRRVPGTVGVLDLHRRLQRRRTGFLVGPKTDPTY
ncbi:hypothetical protein NDU88_004575 [Pleurodeles waltl]|uniref:Uncharacterized protein n=1 Tax=Pleurodeles waltl TaxID=8319 RepID=A0AAV7QGJ8_PLEWA|nr:hypothetical protein NDU88_004575 [Pleurodeles waltl]